MFHTRQTKHTIFLLLFILFYTPFALATSTDGEVVFDNTPDDGQVIFDDEKTQDSNNIAHKSKKKKINRKIVVK